MPKLSIYLPDSVHAHVAGTGNVSARLAQVTRRYAELMANAMPDLSEAEWTALGHLLPADWPANDSFVFLRTMRTFVSEMELPPPIAAKLAKQGFDHTVLNAKVREFGHVELLAVTDELERRRQVAATRKGR